MSKMLSFRERQEQLRKVYTGEVCWPNRPLFVVNSEGGEGFIYTFSRHRIYLHRGQDTITDMDMLRATVVEYTKSGPGGRKLPAPEMVVAKGWAVQDGALDRKVWEMPKRGDASQKLASGG